MASSFQVLDIKDVMPELKKRKLGKFEVPPEVSSMTARDVVDRLIVAYKYGKDERDEAVRGLWLGVRQWLMGSKKFEELTERLHYMLLEFSDKGVDAPKPLEAYVHRWIEKVIADPSLLNGERVAEIVSKNPRLQVKQ